jgi:6-pyruvoyltetrahydropterin/6-carboxytetrahydropterin synthase
MKTYSVRVSSDDLTFSAAHFVIFGPEQREPLHGHNYRVSAEVAGQLDSCHCVIDFIALRDALRELLSEMDHRMLLPGEQPLLQLAADEQELEVRFARQRWVFPQSDCSVLPIANVTAELLADYIGKRLADTLTSRTGRRPERLRVEVQESFGQSAACEIDVPAPD